MLCTHYDIPFCVNDRHSAEVSVRLTQFIPQSDCVEIGRDALMGVDCTP